jgi:hypothetical protein
MKKERKTLYEKKVLPKLEQIKQWRKEGQTEYNIAKLLGISYPSFALYKTKYPEFGKLMDDARDLLIEELENTMYQTAMGKIKIRETKRYIQQNGGKEQVRVEETVKELPPNPTLLIFTLKNMAPQRWRDVQTITGVSVDAALGNMEKVFSELREKLDDIEPPKTE